MDFEIQEHTQDMIISMNKKDLSCIYPDLGNWWVCDPKLPSQKDITVFIGRESNDSRFKDIPSLDLGTKILEPDYQKRIVYHINLGSKAYKSVEQTGSSKERMPGGSSLIIKLHTKTL